MVEFALENNTQQQNQGQQELLKQSSLTGAISRTTSRVPDDGGDAVRDANKNAVAKTYHTLKDLISSKFKKDSNETMDELNNVVVQQQHHQQQQQQQTPSTNGQFALQSKEQEEYRSPYSALPMHMRQMQGLNQSQPNIWNGKQMDQPHPLAVMRTPNGGGQSMQRGMYDASDMTRGVQQRATSQPQLNAPFERQSTQHVLGVTENRSMANIADVVTDSDDGGFAARPAVRRPQTMYQINQQTASGQQAPPPLPPGQRNSPHTFGSSNPGMPYGQQQQYISPYQHSHGGNNQSQATPSSHSQQPYGNLTNGSQGSAMLNHSTPTQQQIFGESPYNAPIGVKSDVHKSAQEEYALAQARHESQRASFQKQHQTSQHMQQQHSQSSTPSQQQTQSHSQQQSIMAQQQPQRQTPNGVTPAPRMDMRQSSALDKQVGGSANSSDYDKSGNHSSNVDSGRGSAAYSSGRKAPLDTEGFELTVRGGMKSDDSEWVDIVDAELRHILEPGMQGIQIRPDSTVSGSVSSISPPLPPLSPDGSSYKPPKSTKEPAKQEYGTDSYNRPGRTSGPIGPSRAGWPGSSLQKQGRPTGKKHEQTMLKRHLFGLDNDLTSNTTLSLDVESLLGGPWGTGQSVSDSETDTQDIRHIRSQLEGLEHMYSEVLKMLGTRNPTGRLHENVGFRAGIRRRHGSLSSLPSSSVSGRPLRDRKRTDDRRKVRDMKGINKRFQRLESHVVTLARSVAHLSSEMRSQHLVTQELERLRDDLANLRSQANRSQNLYRSTSTNNEPEPPNLTNPKRVKKLTKFFGEDPPLMRLFLKKLGYEKYANLFEAERVGMIELPYLGEERLQKLGVPLGPRLRILQEAQISLCKDTTLCIV